MDLKQKKSAYITKNNDLLRINQIYITHFAGSPLWNIFCEETTKLESTWNESIKLMMALPLATHINLFEPLSGYQHIRKVMVKRFLGFLSQVEKSPKAIPRQLLNNIKYDVRSTTGRNLRKILLLTEKTSVDQLGANDYSSVEYHPLRPEETWKVTFIKELIDIKFGRKTVEDFDMDDIGEFFCFLATS